MPLLYFMEVVKVEKQEKKGKTFQEAFLAAQAAIEQPKRTAENPHFRSRYAPLDEVIRVARAALHKEGIAFSQNLDYQEGIVYVTTLFFYGDEVHRAGMIGMPCPQDPQKLGALVTYLRRYALAAALGLASEEDDDANAASGGAQAPAPAAKDPHPGPETLPVTQQQLRMLYARGYAAKLGKDEIKQIIDGFVIEEGGKKVLPRDRFDACLAEIEARAAAKQNDVESEADDYVFE